MALSFTIKAKRMTHDQIWAVKQLSRNVFETRFIARQSKDWEQWVLLTSDQHWDNPKCDRQMLKAHLDLALKRNAPVFSNGDTFCAMQGKYDKRASKSALRPEHQVDNYLDTIVNDAAEWFAPYAKNHICFGVGNHESSIKTKLETDLIERLVCLLNAKTGSSVYNGGFSGWLRFSFCFDSSRGLKTVHKTITAHYDHGYGGSAPVTDDIIQHQRRAVYLPDADIVLSGHTHGAFMQERARVRLSKAGRVYHDVQTHIKLSSYKDDRGDGFGGWASEKGIPPKPLGGWWLRFYYCPRRVAVLYEAVRAQ